jgi:hypothetical protein
LHFCPLPVISHIWVTALKEMHMPASTLCQEPKQPKLLDEVLQYLRLHHYSIHTERSYVDWIVRFIRFTTGMVVSSGSISNERTLIGNTPKEGGGIPEEGKPYPLLG